MKRDNFKLKSARMSKEGVDATFVETRNVDGESKPILHHIESSIVPHPDLLDLRDKLKMVLVKAFGFDSVLNEAEKHVPKGAKMTKVTNKYLDVLNKIEVTKVSISGEDQLRGAVVSGKIESFNGAKSAINSPRVVFSSEKIGLEKDTQKTVDLICIEVYKYFFENKRAQLDLFDDKNKDKPKAANKTKKENAGTLA